MALGSWPWFKSSIDLALENHLICKCFVIVRIFTNLNTGSGICHEQVLLFIIFSSKNTHTHTLIKLYKYSDDRHKKGNYGWIYYLFSMNYKKIDKKKYDS